MSIHIRPAAYADIRWLHALLPELGYELPLDEFSDQFAEYQVSDYARLIVATDSLSARIIGFVAVALVPLVHQHASLGRITALVVASQVRRQGVATSLIAAALAWFRSNECERVEVTSGEKRQAAHAFYNACGFTPVSKRFIKHLE